MNSDFSAGLDDLDDDDNKKKGGKEQIQAAQEEEKDDKKPVKPTFKGRMNLKGTGDTNDGENAGVVKDYDFGLKFKTNNGENKEGGEKRNDRNVDRKDRRQPKDKGMSLNSFNNKGNFDDEEGFEIVGRDTRKKKNKKDDSSSEDEGNKKFGGFKRNTGEAIRGARVERGGTRGGTRGGRGGKQE